MSDKQTITRAAELESLQVFRDFIGAAGARAGIPDATIYDLKLAADEACANIITHGYAGMNPGSIMLELDVNRARVVMTITDFGQPFEPYEPPTPDAAALLAGETAGGFGLFFIHSTMDHVDYQTNEEGNHLLLTKILQ